MYHRSTYDGRFRFVGRNIYQAGSLNDRSPRDHMDDDASDLRRVGGEIRIDVNEIENSGSFAAELELPEGRYRVELERFHEFSPCQDGVLPPTCSSMAMPVVATAIGPRACYSWPAGVTEVPA